MTDQYPTEVLGEDEDDGTMPENVAELSKSVVVRRIVAVEKETIEKPDSWRGAQPATVLTLDDGTQVQLFDTDDCCAYTELESFLLHHDRIDHVITGVGTTEGYTVWHVFADFGDVMEMRVGWSCGNPFYYGYGFDIRVVPVPEPATTEGRAG